MPTVLFPPATPFTLQLTPVPATPFVIAAEKFMIPPVARVIGEVLGLVIETETMTGAVTVKTAVVVVAASAEFVNTAWYKFPVSAKEAVKLNGADVAPTIPLNDAPPFVLTNHCTAGAGCPLAAAVNVAMSPAITDSFVGFVVIIGATETVSVAVVVVALLTEFVNTALYWFPVIPAVTANVNVGDVAPFRFANVVPPLVLTCHCTVGAGAPVAAAVNVAFAPATTVTFSGFVVTAGADVVVNVAAVVVSVPIEFANTALY